MIIVKYVVVANFETKGILMIIIIIVTMKNITI